MRKLLATLALITVVLITGCKKDEYLAKVGVCPEVISTIPTRDAKDVPLNQIISATFNTDMDPATINSTTFTIKQGTALISGKVAPTSNGATFTFKPDVALLPFITYTGTITNGAKDKLRTAIVSDYVWTFTTIPQLTLSSMPALGGTTSGAGLFAQGSTVTVVATANDGFTFFNWTDGATVASTSATYQLTMAGNKALVANYAVIQYTVAVSSNPLLGGITTGAGAFNLGSSVTVTATPNAGYTFTNWTENGIIVPAAPAIYTFTISGGRTLVANYTAIPYTVKVSSNPVLGGMTTGTGVFYTGTSVTVTAVANTGYTFTNWTENGIIVLAAPAIYTFTISGDRTLVANYSAIPYTVALSINPSTLVNKPTGDGTFNSGTLVTVTALVNAGYTFTNWTENGTIVPAAPAIYTFTISGDRNLKANYTAIPAIQYTVTLSSNPLLGGITTGGGTFNPGASVPITAVANAGYTFKNWTDGVNIVSPLANHTFTITGSRTLVANFTAISYTVEISSNPLLGGITSGRGTFNSGSSVPITAVANAGFTFKNWTEGVNIVSPLASYSFTINSDRILVANFTATWHTVTLSSSPLLGGTTVGAGTYNLGASVPITAVANVGYTFVNWTEGINIVSSSSSYQITNLSGSRTLVANFVVKTYTLNVTANNGTVGKSPNPDPVTLKYNHGTLVTLTATPSSGYTFASWTGDANIPIAPLVTTVIMNSDKNITANFTLIPVGPPAIDLKSAGNYGMLAGTAITNAAGPSEIHDMNIGIYPGARTQIVGFFDVDGGPGHIYNGVFQAADDGAAVAAILLQAKTDLTAAYNDLAGASDPAPATISGDQGGKTLYPGIYKSTSSLLIQSGDLTLDAQGDPNAVWIFQIATDFTSIGGGPFPSSTGGNVKLTGFAQAKNVYWQVGSSATIGDYTQFYGNIVALTTITMNSFAKAQGRLLARNGAVTMSSTNILTKP